MAIQIGKYKRPGIFMEEIDKSVFSTPTTDGMTNLVIGVSKKGPVNTPIRLTTTGELEAVFGQLDRNLERSGSFFHRTVSKMLESTPVYAMNLLLTNDALDTLEYKSLSTCSGEYNDILREGPYRRFFDTTGFWSKDAESFLNITKKDGHDENQRHAIGFTNMSDRHITVFAVKSQMVGFDRTLLEWYGSAEKMPPYVNQSDYASDYMVDVVVVGGDWSNYQQLSVDPRWSQYFTSEGLKKDQLRNFANDRNITLLNYYEGLSLIPYFRDLTGRNIFIETQINRDTDSTGLFCYFDAELVEKNYYTGVLDLIGNTMVGMTSSKIEFLSYDENISEVIVYDNKPLDLPGNVISIFGDIFGLTGSLYVMTNTTTGVTGSYTDVPLTGSKNGGSGAIGTIEVAGGIVTSVTVTTEGFGYSAGENISIDKTIIGGNTNVALEVLSDNLNSISDINNYNDQDEHAYGVPAQTGILESTYRTGYFGEGSVSGILRETLSGSTSSITVSYIASLDADSGESNPSFAVIGGNYVSFNPTASFTLNASDYTVSGGYTTVFVLKATGEIVSIKGTVKDIKPIVELSDIVLGSIKFNVTSGSIDIESISMRDMSVNKLGFGDLTFGGSSTCEFNITEVLTPVAPYTSAFKVEFIGTNTPLSLSSYKQLRSIKLFNELVDTLDSNNRKYASIVVNQKSSEKYSLENASITEIETRTNYNKSFVLNSNISDLTDILKGFLIIYKNDDEFILGNSDMTTTDIVADLNTGNGIVAKYSKFYKDFLNGYINTGDYFVTNTDLVYLKMFINSSNNLMVSYVDAPIDLIIGNSINVTSDKSNLTESIEIETPYGYVTSPNKILVNGSRYSNLKVGDFLEADITSQDIELGETPRSLTRILNKRQYAADPTLSEISCDSAIKLLFTDSSEATQAIKYTSIDQYANTYKAITLKGFRMRQSSLPDGTEERQNQILNLVAKGTPLFKSLINKEAFDFRYLVDSFGLGLTERSKQQLVDICGERLEAFGFINMPSIKSFKNSSSPSFVDSEGVLQVEYIAKGGDPESNPAFLYSFGEGAGTTCTGYFTPYVTVNDNGRPLSFPPSSYVATTYVRKHISNISSVTPWTIAAGVTNGKVTNIAGLEIDFAPEDIEFLNQAQMNPIVLKRNRGYIIETENTAQTLYKSALSYIHSREVLIELERELSRMLLDYQWKFNTPDVRAEIKLRADVICETFVSKNGLYNYFNKMDDENNTAEVIDNQMGVLDTYVEIIKGMGIIVNNITILSTGTIASGGFINA